ncbi:transmembrane protein 26b isoform X1 [Lepisosteus oculatus]|uniref:Transmembrane protein 26a n=1 Tax=Lepisosteus oculatus TaxID=7918 RepID=W5MIC0_LEPOC|nr:PREDICTED: transmembrane protein 26 isoform X1 [Lepisosteus oculatus]
MIFVKFVCAVVTRFFFILLSLIGVWRVTEVKQNKLYWLLTILYLPLVAEMIYTLKRRKGKDYKWFSPAILLFLVSIIPSIWILELHTHQNKVIDQKCKKLDSYESIKDIVPIGSRGNLTFQNSTQLSNLCDDAWTLALHQILLILLIIGKWLLPIGAGITRDELSQLLLIFVGIAADILEFTSETLSDVKDNNNLVYAILAVWTWSMLQFPLHLAVLTSRPEDTTEGQPDSLLQRHRTDIWCIVESLFIHDGPFLVVRLVVMTYYKVINQMLAFFAIKNLLVVSLQVYRLLVIYQDYRSSVYGL